MIIAAVAILPYQNNLKQETRFIGLHCPRGYIMPGGKYDPNLDQSWHGTAIREAQEETGTNVYKTKFVFGAPDHTGDYFCFGVWCPLHDGVLRDSREGKAMIVTQDQLLSSVYGPWYRCLFDILKEKELIV